MSHGTGILRSHTLQPHQRLYQLKEGTVGTSVTLGNAAANSCHIIVQIAFICSREQTPQHYCPELVKHECEVFLGVTQPSNLLLSRTNGVLPFPTAVGSHLLPWLSAFPTNLWRVKLSSLPYQETNSRRKTKLAKQGECSTGGNTQSTLRVFSSSFKLLYSVNNFLTHSHHACQMLH